METYYLVDYESVNDRGIENIPTLTMNEHVHVFLSENAMKGNLCFAYAKNTKVVGHIVKKGKKGDQALDKQLASYLGYLIAKHGKECEYVIVSLDKGYKSVVEFWDEEIEQKISILPKIPAVKQPKKTGAKTEKQQNNLQNQSVISQSQDEIINIGLNSVAGGADKTKLNEFVQHKLKEMGYDNEVYNRVCKIVCKCIKAEDKLNEIHRVLKEEYGDDSEIHENVNMVLEEFSTIGIFKIERDDEIKKFYKENFKKKKYVDNEKATIKVLTKAKTVQDVNNGLLKIYKNGQIVKNMKEKMKPLLDEIFK